MLLFESVTLQMSCQSHSISCLILYPLLSVFRSKMFPLRSKGEFINFLVAVLKLKVTWIMIILIKHNTDTESVTNSQKHFLKIKDETFPKHRSLQMKMGLSGLSSWFEMGPWEKDVRDKLGKGLLGGSQEKRLTPAAWQSTFGEEKL